jgi:hypothetical protein
MRESAVREAHHREVEIIFDAAGCKRSRGNVTFWNGQRFQELLGPSGHSSLGFNECCCRSKITISNKQEWAELSANNYEM